MGVLLGKNKRSQVDIAELAILLATNPPWKMPKLCRAPDESNMHGKGALVLNPRHSALECPHGVKFALGQAPGNIAGVARQRGIARQDRGRFRCRETKRAT
jgi:hypothetical protein